ncbi:putative tricarboxylic transport membrane protein [Desulfofundulus australicus DSM 11792]|uniref:Putative tricarboxylic transport membrane protein n=1 Tax=Desulfofundulus australicus DSM 11792 TaxID=1121425 RepID=A0A1M4SH03_9FIRM|nr:tripartite tricarboxylate transporter permease [Desulfofundulus australicus]SHE31438.1 putative tricarboxylic transport membrane protein [Desulfofundulus australicus DSM 11792]
MWEQIGAGLINALQPFNLFLAIAGLTGGIIIGALPGLTATMGVALMVPLTFAMDPASGLIMLGAIYSGAIYGGSNSAILINTPGTPSAVATTFDGWPMCRAGKADEALNTSLIASAFGGLVGTLFLLFLAAPLARLALKFGAPEFFWLCIFGLSTIAAMSTGNVFKGLVSGALGLLVSTIGLDPIEGVPRFTFGYYPLVQGIEVIPAMIGLFSFSQVINLVGSRQKYIADYKPNPGAFMRVVRKLWKDCKMILTRSSIIGTIVGILPGAGGEIASIIAYNESKRWDKNPSRYGTGIVEGLASSESANNATIGGSLIPMLCLGIPGSAVAAVMMGALLVHGITPGFKIFTDSGNLAYTFITSLLLVNVLMVLVGSILIKGTARVLNVPTSYIGVAVVALSIIGSYAIRNSMLDVMIMIFFGLVGYFGSRIGLDTGAMALGIILGPIAEENLAKSLALAGADGSVFKVFFTSPISLILIILTVLSVITSWLLSRRRGGDVKEAVESGRA